MPAAAAAIAGEQEVEVAVEPAAFDRQAALISSDLSRMSACTSSNVDDGEWNCLMKCNCNCCVAPVDAEHVAVMRREWHKMQAAPVVDVTSSGAAAALLLLLFRLRCRVVVAVVAVVLVEDDDDDDEEDLDKTPRQLLDRVDVDEQPPRLASMFVAYMIDQSINCKYDVDVFAMMFLLRDVEVRLNLFD